MKQNTITPSATLIDAARSIESTKRLAVVIDQESRVIGTLTDGDIRRSLQKILIKNYRELSLFNV